jgi:hypothetical protein
MSQKIRYTTILLLSLMSAKHKGADWQLFTTLESTSAIAFSSFV